MGYPYDRDSEIPRLTMEKIRRDLAAGQGFLWGLTVVEAMCLALSGGILTFALRGTAGATKLGQYPVVLHLLVAVVWLGVLGFMVWRAGQLIRDNRLARSGEVHVQTCVLETISRDEFQGMRYRRGHRVPEYRDVFYFAGMEKYFVGTDMLERSAEGDEFLVVVYDKQPTKPMLIYRADAYRWP